jgi:cytochrome b561
LRRTHAVLAFLLFATFLAHFAAALMHALIYRHGVFQSMASRKVRIGEVAKGRRSDSPRTPNA